MRHFGKSFRPVSLAICAMLLITALIVINPWQKGQNQISLSTQTEVEIKLFEPESRIFSSHELIKETRDFTMSENPGFLSQTYEMNSLFVSEEIDNQPWFSFPAQPNLPAYAFAIANPAVLLTPFFSSLPVSPDFSANTVEIGNLPFEPKIEKVKWRSAEREIEIIVQAADIFSLNRNLKQENLNLYVKAFNAFDLGYTRLQFSPAESFSAEGLSNSSPIFISIFDLIPDGCNQKGCVKLVESPPRKQPITIKSLPAKVVFLLWKNRKPPAEGTDEPDLRFVISMQ